MARTCNVNDLNGVSFERFGAILHEGPERSADVDNEEITYWDGTGLVDGAVVFGYMEAKRRELVIAKMERHVRTPEVLVVLEGDCCLAVAPGDIRPDLEGLYAFRMSAGDCVLMKPGIWHCLPYPEGPTARFLVMKKASPQNDLEIQEIERVALKR